MMQRRRRESGFAMLMVFVMAAVVAIGLYYEMPRRAFESQRFREQTLVDRGNQYRRAIQLFYRKFGRYPATMDDLETTNNIRFLRRKYKDPMTGKDEWRLIHMGPGGMLTDSLVQKAQNPLGPSTSGTGTGSGTGTASSTGTGTGTDPNDQTSGLNLAVVRRPSDQMVNGPPAGGQPVDPNDPNQPVPTAPPGQPVVPGQVPGQPVGPGQFPGQPVNPNPNQPYDPNNPNPNPNPNPLPGAPLQPYDPNNPNPPQPPPGFVQGRGGFITAPPVSSVGTTPTPQGQPGTSANGIIQNLLTTPRQAPGASSSTTSGFGTTTPGITGGIAGVASKYEGTGIKIIHDRKKYKEWEFVYDFKNDSGKGQQIPGQAPGQNGQVTPNGLGVPGTTTGTGAPTATPTTGTTPIPQPTSQ